LLSRSGLTRLIDRMATAGYVDRETCPSDRRGAYAVLTPAGKKALATAWPSHARGVAEHFARHLDADDAKRLTEMLGRVIAPLAATTRPCSGAA
jgi:DNA-binding MarR family transcriptional regulator